MTSLPPPSWRSRRFALLVVTDTYEDPSFAGLDSPMPDAQRLAATLRDSAIGGFEVLPLSVNEPSYVIRRMVEEFLSGLRRDELGVLYFASHGVKDDSGRFYFAATDTRPRLLGATAVAASFVHERLQDCNAGQVLTVIDCCNSGAFPPGYAARSTAEVRAGQEALQGEGWVVLTASNAVEYAFESGAGPADRRPAAAVFTDALIEGLRTGSADRDRDGWVSAHDLYEDVRDRVRACGARQTPTLWSRVSGELYVARNPFHVPAAATAGQVAGPAASIAGQCRLIWLDAPFEAGLADALVALWGDLSRYGVQRVLDVVRVHPSGPDVVAAGVEVVHALRRVDQDPGLAAAVRRVVHGLVAYGSRDDLAEPLADAITALRQAVAALRWFLREEEHLPQELGEMLDEASGLMRTNLERADPAGLADAARTFADGLRRLARFIRGFVGDTDLELQLGELATAIGDQLGGRPARRALARLTGAAYAFSGEVWRAPAGATSTWLQAETAEFRAELAVSGVTDADTADLVAGLTTGAEWIRSLAGQPDVAERVREFAGVLREKPDVLAGLLASTSDALLTAVKALQPLAPDRAAASEPPTPDQAAASEPPAGAPGDGGHLSRRRRQERSPRGRALRRLGRRGPD